eukprot:XP_011682808.1 PREDICTED: uncharacterized protein LOC105446983 [Strongylocentrotus purpuratus]
MAEPDHNNHHPSLISEATGETRQRVAATTFSATTTMTTHQQTTGSTPPGQATAPMRRGRQQQDSKKYGYFSRNESVRRSGKRLASKRREIEDSEAAKLTGILKILIKTKASCVSIRVCAAKELKMPCRTQQCTLYARISLVTQGKEILREFTSVQHDTREPKFDKTFYIPLELVQLSSRLVIHLNRQTGKRFDDVIGCMSFGMKNMISSSKVRRLHSITIIIHKKEEENSMLTIYNCFGNKLAAQIPNTHLPLAQVASLANYKQASFPL